MPPMKRPILSISSELKEKLLNGLYIILFGAISYFVWYAILLISIFQFVCTLIFKKPNADVSCFAQNLSTYYYEVVQFLTFNSNEKPFPLSPFPSGKKGL